MGGGWVKSLKGTDGFDSCNIKRTSESPSYNLLKGGHKKKSQARELAPRLRMTVVKTLQNTTFSLEGCPRKVSISISHLHQGGAQRREVPKGPEKRKFLQQSTKKKVRQGRPGNSRAKNCHPPQATMPDRD